MKAIWNGVIIAEADKKDVKIVEGNAYFPGESIKKKFFKKSDTTSSCPWKGKASYFDVIVKGKTNKDAAWSYSEPKPEALHIRTS